MTKATVKKYIFTISAKVGSVWKSVANYVVSKASLPQAIAAFYKFFDSWKITSVEYRFDASINGPVLWSDSFIPNIDES